MLLRMRHDENQPDIQHLRDAFAITVQGVAAGLFCCFFWFHLCDDALAIAVQGVEKERERERERERRDFIRKQSP